MLLDHAVPQQQRPLHLRPAQVEVAVLQPQVFARQFLAVGVRRNGGVRLLLSSLKSVTRSSISPVASFGFAMPAGRSATLPVTWITYSARSVLLSFDDRGRRVGRIEDDLRHAVAVAQVDEQAAAVVAVAVDPAAERDRLADVFGAQFAAGMSSQHAEPLIRSMSQFR